MCEWSLVVRIYDYLLINNKKLSISDEFMGSVATKISTTSSAEYAKSENCWYSDSWFHYSTAVRVFYYR
jgi:hypothetical protein